MKRNSMLTKIIAVLLCALMVAAWLPKTSAAANDFESGMDRIYGTDAANAMPLVIGTNADSGLANAYYAYTPAEDGTLTLTAEDGTTFTVDGVAYTDAVAVTAGTKYIIVATNEAKAYSFTAAFEVASAAIELVIGTNANEGAEVTYTYTPDVAGRLVLAAEDGTTWTVDGVAYFDAVEVAAGTTYTIVASNAAEAHSFTATLYQFDELLTLVNQNFSLGASIEAVFRVNTKVRPKTASGYETKGYDKVWLSITHNRPTAVSSGEVTTIDICDESTQAVIYQYKYEFYAKEFKDLLEITIFAEKDGGFYCSSVVYEWSAKNKMVEMFNTNYANKDTDTKAYNTCVLLATMLNYGEKAQIRYGYDVDNLVTDGLDASILNMIPTEDPVFTQTIDKDNSGSNVLRNVGVKTVSKVELTNQFKLADSNYANYEVKYTYVENDATSELVINANDAGTKSGTNILITYNALVARQMRIPVTVQLYQKDGGALSRAYVISLEAALKTFVDNAESNPTDTNLKNAELAKAIMTFGDAAAVYFA